ncbi:MAG: DUF2071 domain-containing protein [Vicinamibacterales bacterium]
MAHDFNYEILNEIDHRPWLMPESPWLMTQTWNDLLFAHWPVGAAELRPLVPPMLELDLFEGQAWIAVVPFHMSNVVPRGVPALPWISAFPELNVRTYVRLNGRGGVYFFSLDATNPVAVGIARTLVHLPYFRAAMTVDDKDGWVSYQSSRSSAPAEFVGRYRPVGPAAAPASGTLEHFLTERYCLFTTDNSGRALSLDIHHPPWLLQLAEAEIARNTMALAAGITLPAIAPLLHFSKRQDMVGWRLKQA